MVAGHPQEQKGYLYMVLSYPDDAGKKKKSANGKNRLQTEFFGGDGGIRTHEPVRANAFRVRPVMTTSIRLHMRAVYDFHTQLLHYNRIISKKKGDI